MKVHKIVKLYLKIFLNNIKYSFEVIKYFLYIYIFLDEKYQFLYNVILLKTISTDNLNIRKKILFLLNIILNNSKIYISN